MTRMLTRDLFAVANIIVGVVISELRDRFDQSGIVTYKLVHFVLLRAFFTKDDFGEVFRFSAMYGDELVVDRLSLRLKMLPELFPRITTISDLITSSERSNQSPVFGEVISAVVPSSSATAERSFSALGIDNDLPTIHCVSAKPEPPSAASRSQGQNE